ncbi:MAG TPA: hypothetical protein ENH29_10375 [Bacteroidetes bacterium]|nr:hypothetical protein [Bacteroidota bacterium]
MRTQSEDTDPKAEKVLIALLRKASIAEKFAQVRSLSKMTMQLSRRAIARVHPELNEEQIDLLFIEYHYGKDLAERLAKSLAGKDAH